MTLSAISLIIIIILIITICLSGMVLYGKLKTPSSGPKSQFAFINGTCTTIIPSGYNGFTYNSLHECQLKNSIPDPSGPPHQHIDTNSTNDGFDMFFPPYDCPTGDQTMIDLQMIEKVTDAAKLYQSKGKLNPNDPTNPFQIKYSVYNLFNVSYLTGLMNAYNAGVYVQVLIQYTQVNELYNHIWANFNKNGMKLLDTKSETQKDITDKTQFDTLNLIPINIGHLMHVKTRYYKFGPDGNTVTIGGKNKHVKECVVTGSFNPECSATKNNEFLIVLSSDKDETPTIINNYLRIYEFTKREDTKFKLPDPIKTDPIYNVTDNLNVIYSRWCKNTDNYMRIILSRFIDNEKSAILLPLYSLSNLDSPFMYQEGNYISVKNASNLKYVVDPDYVTATITIGGISSKLKDWRVKGLGSRIDIDYDYMDGKTKKSKTYSTVIRDINNDKITVISTYTAKDLETGTINNITIYKTLMTNFENAINRGVKIVLLINKSQLDGEISSNGKSFTGGDPKLTGYILEQMGATLYRCTNPNGELHTKSGYFYSQNKLITDTTNWSNAGMGSQNKSGPSCSINAETCLVINGEQFENPELFRTRVLSTFINTMRMYEYQQYCPIKEPDTFGGMKIATPLNKMNFMNCTCPTKERMSCNSTGTKHQGLCSTKFSSQSEPSNCYVTDPSEKSCYGSCTVDCCLRYGQEQANEKYITYDYVLGLLTKMQNWPYFTCNDNKIGKHALGEKVNIGQKMYIIDPTFNWGKGERINNDVLINVIKTRNISGSNLTDITDKNKQGFFCNEKPICH